jgi:hypothetical protein
MPALVAGIQVLFRRGKALLLHDKDVDGRKSPAMTGGKAQSKS